MVFSGMSWVLPVSGSLSSLDSTSLNLLLVDAGRVRRRPGAAGGWAAAAAPAPAVPWPAVGRVRYSVRVAATGQRVAAGRGIGRQAGARRLVSACRAVSALRAGGALGCFGAAAADCRRSSGPCDVVGSVRLPAVLPQANVGRAGVGRAAGWSRSRRWRPSGTPSDWPPLAGFGRYTPVSARNTAARRRCRQIAFKAPGSTSVRTARARASGTGAPTAYTGVLHQDPRGGGSAHPFERDHYRG
jgi:hypothetical protein